MLADITESHCNAADNSLQVRLGSSQHLLPFIQGDSKPMSLNVLDVAVECVLNLWVDLFT